MPARPARPRPHEVVGMPALPPAGLAAWGMRTRARLGRIHRSMVPPPLRLLEGLLGVLDTGAVVALHELRVADALDGWCTVDHLARRLDVEPEPLERLLRYCAARGWLRIDRRGRVGPNAVTRFLRVDHPGGWSKWVDLVGGADVLGAVGALGAAVRSGDEAFAVANGAGFFDWMSGHPERGRAFDGAMAAGGRLHALALDAALDWSGAQRVCDVGGGDGSLLRALLAAHDHLAGVLVDLPAVTDRAEPADRLEIRPGDAFERVPADCDTYLLVNVVHDWSDADAVRLLGRIVSDGPPGARIVVVEAHCSARPADDLAARTDLLMLALAPGGRERTAGELAALGRRAGLRGERVVPLASADFAHVFTR